MKAERFPQRLPNEEAIKEKAFITGTTTANEAWVHLDEITYHCVQREDGKITIPDRSPNKLQVDWIPVGQQAVLAGIARKAMDEARKADEEFERKLGERLRSGDIFD